MVATTQTLRGHKPRMLVVDDEPDNLDLLYRTFRREFDVLRADSGRKALKILSEQGEVAVIISDQRMPEMKGTEFLSKTVSNFPDTVRIILTGFTDVEDLVDAINTGQVYRYITKPWEPDELKHVVKQAATTYELLKLRGEAIHLSTNQHRLIVEMAAIAQSNQDIATALPHMADIIQTVVGCEGCAIQMIESDRPSHQVGLAGTGNSDLICNPMLADAIATHALQCSGDITASCLTEVQALYAATQTATHCLAPVVFQGQVTAIISLQWVQPERLTDIQKKLIQISAQQAALTLACL
jgi:CheY-like chemotaxis protein